MKIISFILFGILLSTNIVGQNNTLYFKCGTKFGDKITAIKNCVEGAQAHNQNYSTQFIKQHCACTIELLVTQLSYEEFLKYNKLYGDDIFGKLALNNINQIRDKYMVCMEDVLIKENFSSNLSNISREDAIKLCVDESKKNPYFKGRDAHPYCSCRIDYIRENGVKVTDLTDPNSQVNRSIEKECE
jgi:hypothetical protein